MELDEVHKGKYSITINLVDKTSEVSWYFTGIYCPCAREGRLECWEEMEDITARRNNRPWIIGGDFNAVMETGERKGSRGLNEADKQLIKFVNRTGLMNSSMEGGSFTWSNFREEPAVSRIDRFLYSPEWLEAFIGIRQKLLERVVSDYFPICLELSAVKWGPSPFRFENAWLKLEGFKELVAQWWKEYHVEGHASFRVTKKLQHLKKNLKVWRKEKYEARLGEKEPLLLEIKRLDEEEEKEGFLSQKKVVRRANIKEKVTELLQKEEIAWRQKSRELWLK